MGRRRQHSGGLALASDQIPGLAQHNIQSGLVTFIAGLARPFANRHFNGTPDQWEKASLRPNRRTGTHLIGRWRGKWPMGK